ncbi:MAG TPA: MFS transporter [Burkholderiaceae bacterium]|nr:MFS transporter [Burkholderiaceae bacterium]
MLVKSSRRSLGAQFEWLWRAFAISTFGTFIAFDAFPLVAIIVLHASPGEVAALAATGRLAGAALALPLGPWVERRQKRSVMIAMDLIRCSTLLSIPLALISGWLSFAQLLVVSVIVAAANITFKAASGAYLKALVRPDELLVANGRFESTTWTATAIGPVIGGAAIGAFGSVTTIVADAVSYLLSAMAIRAIHQPEPLPTHANPLRLKVGDVFDGWRTIWGHPNLRLLFLNTILVNGLIMATAPLVAVLMLGHLGFAPWQYGLAFGVPCVGGFIGSRLVGRIVTRFGQRKVMLVAGALRACWSVGLAFIGPGLAGIALVIAIQFGLVTCIGIFNPLSATYQLEQIETSRVARTLAAWSVAGNATIAVMIFIFGLVANITNPRIAIAIAGVIMLTSPLLLSRFIGAKQQERESTRDGCAISPVLRQEDT